MSNAKGTIGHCLADGTGRDTYAFLQQSTVEIPYKPSKWVPRRQWRRSLDGNSPLQSKRKKFDNPYGLNDVWISELSPDPTYQPKAKPFVYNCKALNRLQKDGDLVRFKERASDIARRERDLAERLLRAERLDTRIPITLTEKPHRLLRTIEPVLDHDKRTAEKPADLTSPAIMIKPYGQRITQPVGFRDEAVNAQNAEGRRAQKANNFPRQRLGTSDQARRQRSVSAIEHRDYDGGLDGRTGPRQGLLPFSLSGRQTSHGHRRVEAGLEEEGPFIEPRDIMTAGPGLRRKPGFRSQGGGGGRVQPRPLPAGALSGGPGLGQPEGDGEWVWVRVAPQTRDGAK